MLLILFVVLPMRVLERRRGYCRAHRRCEAAQRVLKGEEQRREARRRPYERGGPGEESEGDFLEARRWDRRGQDVATNARSEHEHVAVATGPGSSQLALDDGEQCLGVPAPEGLMRLACSISGL